jgi:twitching motility protein PilT
MADSAGPSSSVYGNEAYINQLLAKAVAAKASDIHLKVGIPPAARVRGDLVFFRTEPLRPEDTENIARVVIKDPKVKADVANLREHDTAYAAKDVGRFRVNVYRQRGTIGIVMRAIPTKIPFFEDLGCPSACSMLAEKDRGLVLVVGAAGNGKSSTLAAMIGHLNRTQPLHIVTIEDPIEFLRVGPPTAGRVGSPEAGSQFLSCAEVAMAPNLC